MRGPSPIPGPTAQGCSARKISCHNYWLQKPAEVESADETWTHKQFLLKKPHMDLLRLTSSEGQHWGSSLKGTSGIQGETEVSSIKVRAGGQFSPSEKGDRGHYSFSEASPEIGTELSGRWCI